VISAKQYLSARKGADVFQIFRTLGHVPTPTVITCKEKRIFRLDQLLAVSPENGFVILPNRIMKLPGSFQFRLKMKMKIPDSI
jgi:hypothetical protein